MRFSYELATPTDPVAFAPISDAIRAASGWPVSRQDALSVPAVLRGRNLICSISTLPLVTRDRGRNSVRAPLLEQIDPDIANVVTLSQTVEDLLFEGISWWQVTERGSDRYPRSAMHLDEASVTLQPPADAWRKLRTLPSEQRLPSGVVWVHGEPVSTRDMIRFDSPNPGILKAAARAIRRAILLDQAAATYATDPRPLDYFRPSDPHADPVEDDEVQAILDAWRVARRKRSTAYVPAALTYETVDMPSPADLQLAQLQKQATLEIANAMGLDAEDLQVSTTSRTYANAVDRRRDRINDVFSMYMSAISDRLSMGDVTRRGQRVGWDLDEYMRANPVERWQTYEIGLRNEVVSVPEIREEEGLPAVPVEPAVRPRRTPPPSGVRPQETQQEAGMSRSRAAQFSDDGDGTRFAFDLSTADAQFKVDAEKRTVSGLLVPWNKVARSGFAKWRFAPNSLRWADVSRVKLNRDHDRRQSVGYAVRLDSTADGLTGTFKIARGAAGDEVLSLAEDKVLDGFSIEVDFDPDGTSWARDPDDDMVRLVSDAPLVGVAITPAPAFDDARLTGVTASRYSNRKDSPVGDEPQGTQTQTPAATPDPTTIAAFTQAIEAFSAQAGAFTDAIGHLVEVQQNGGEGPATVDPTRPTAQFQVNEEPVYRFDGSMGKEDFSSDIIAGAKGDYEALKRAQDWISTHFSSAAFAVTTSNVATLNPSIQRPDLYVDQLDYPTPIWDAINKGTIDKNTPFVLPKFNTSSGLVGDHTQGTEPTPGALTTTSQTITPSAVSGKVEVTREAWDQGGNPQLSTILWRQMVRAYNEALESAGATLLEGLTVTAITLTAGAVDGALAQEVKEALAALQFVRGGFRFRDFVLEQGLYTALAAAKDSTGRPLFPMLGAMNADGTLSPFFAAINVGGLAGQPSWALPFTDGAANDSYLFNREDVHGWASNPQRLDFEYRVAFVDVAIWGYKALACTRTDGVRKITYDNAA